MKIYLKSAIFINKAPFEKIELDFEENEIAVLSAINGRGKTTILSHIADCFYEMTKPYFSDFEKNKNKYYRISSPIYNLKRNDPSFVYLRFMTPDGNIDYVDIYGNCTEIQYNEAISLENKIEFSKLETPLKRDMNVKRVSAAFNKEKAVSIFSSNITTYFPAYRYENPGFLNDVYKIKLDFKSESGFTGYLNNPIEIVTGLKPLANWILDIVLDQQLYSDTGVEVILENINKLVSNALNSKKLGELRLGVGPRGYGGTRIQVIRKSDNTCIYPSIFNLSSGEYALLCLFGEILRQSDNYSKNIKLHDITGIVLIDEVDKHLHIKLQKEILPILLNLFPNVQFITSSHSPFLSMGLAEISKDRSKVVDLDNFGISNDPTTNNLYREVYELMINENARFKENYESIKNQVDNKKKIQLISEGNNIEHIKKAVKILDKTVLDNLNFIVGAEDKSGDKQLKNAFEIMSKTDGDSKFLFVWDFDSENCCDSVVETKKYKKFSFKKNESNSKITKGIENLYPMNLFTKNVYETKTTQTEYGGKKIELIFNKKKFLLKIQKRNEKKIFKNYISLIEKVKDIINSD